MIMNPVIKLTRIKIYNCKRCTAIFPSTEQLEKHTTTHKHGSGVFKCNNCNSWFQTNRECTQHEMSHLPRKCNSYYNSYSIENKNNLKPYNLKVEPIKEFPDPYINNNGSVICPKCDKILKNPKLYKQHCNIHHNRKYLCQFCDKGFGTKGILIGHIKKHIDKIERPYKCKVCGKGFTQYTSVKLHKKRMHDRIFDQKCKYCKKAFPDKGALTLHIRTHTGHKPYQCNYCTKPFSDPSAFKRHIRTHTGEMKYACTECPMKFTDSSGLYAHIKRHIGIKNFKCSVCGKLFIDNSQLKTHKEAMHERVKKYECHHCGKKTTTNVLLQSHIHRVHTKESAKYKCGFCGKHLTTRRFFENHLLHIHNMDVHLEEKPKSDSISEKKSTLCLKYDDNAEKNRLIHEEVSILKETLQKRETKPLFECRYCEKEFNDKTGMKFHMYRFHGKENNKKRSSKEDEALHCSDCGEKFYSKTSLSRHVETHENASYCDNCEAEFFTLKDLQKHKIKCLKNRK